MSNCKIELCERKHHAKGYCAYHYQKIYLKEKYKDVECSIEGCNNCVAVAFTKDRLCCKHGTRKSRYGDTAITKRSRALYSIVDEMTNSDNPLEVEIKDDGMFSEISRIYHGNICMECGWNIGRCEAHHKIHRSKGGKNVLSNALILCPNCHSLKHVGKSNRLSGETIQELKDLATKWG